MKSTLINHSIREKRHSIALTRVPIFGYPHTLEWDKRPSIGFSDERVTADFFNGAKQRPGMKTSVAATYVGMRPASIPEYVATIRSLIGLRPDPTAAKLEALLVDDFHNHTMLTSTHVDYNSFSDDVLAHAYLYADHRECPLDFKGPSGSFPQTLQWSGNFVPESKELLRLPAKDPVAMLLFGTDDVVGVSRAFSMLYASEGEDATPYLSRPGNKYNVYHDSHPLTISGFLGKLRILSISLHGPLRVRPVLVTGSP